MKITVAKSAGFCFGVKRAVKIALEAAKKEKNVEMLGDIVHNEDVIKEIRKAGIIKIEKLKDGKNKTLLIRAHGVPQKTIQKAGELGYKIIDATCPMVKGIHKIAKDMEQKGFYIIIIGDKKHDEVKGIAGQLKSKAFIIQDTRELKAKKEKIGKIKKACVVAQSTQTEENVSKIISFLKKEIKTIVFFNTICRPTKIKQREIQTMPRHNDVMLIIGSKTSANTRRLYEISKSINKKSYWVQSPKDIKCSWFKNTRGVGITAGSSTPDFTTQAIVAHLKKISPRTNCLNAG